MIKIRLFPSLVLVAVSLVACAPWSGPVSSSQTASDFTPTVIPTLNTSTAVAMAPSETLMPSPLPVATSRGPELHATDPTTVDLASGGLQLVEFFRFTWATCRSMAPMVHGLEAKYFGRIQFTYLDADDPQTLDFQRSLGFYYQPELYLLDGEGKVLEKWIGYTSQEDLDSALTHHLQ